MDQIMDKIYCPRCGAEHPASAFFCNDCGFPLRQKPMPPVNSPYQQPYPLIYQVPPKIPGKGFGIASMVLGILGLLYSFCCLSLGISILELQLNYSYEYYVYNTFDFDLAMLMSAIMISVMPILGIIFGCNARRRGYKNGISTSGIVTGSIGCAFILIAILISVI